MRNFLLIAVALVVLVTISGRATSYEPSFPVVPEFTHTDDADWINSKPLTTEQLKGNVVLIDVWTFACWNCYRSFPWLNSLEEKFSDEPFKIIGVHTPEFDYEKVRSNVEEKVAEFKLHHPIMMDNDFSYWKALGNKYWPAYYLIDKEGNARGYWIGETHAGQKRALEIESAVRELLAE